MNIDYSGLKRASNRDRKLKHRKKIAYAKRQFRKKEPAMTETTLPMGDTTITDEGYEIDDNGEVVVNDDD